MSLLSILSAIVSSPVLAVRRLRPWVITVIALLVGAAILLSPIGAAPPTAHPPLATITDVTPIPAASPAAVTLSAGEDPSTVVVSWPAPAQPPSATAVDVYRSPSAGAGAGAGPLLVSVPVAAGAHAVALPALPPGGTAVVTVVLSAPSGTTTLGPSAPFPTTPSPAPSSASSSGPARSAILSPPPSVPVPCLGAGYGVGRVTVNGYAGVQGSYCVPPAFTSGAGAFCADHGLDYPVGVAGYGWVSSVAGTATALSNQYGRATDPADVARLAWIYATWATTTDPARAVAVGIITHAVMGDYPGLAVADLDPPRMAVAGGDPAAIVADVGTMWHAAEAAAGPYTMHIDPGPGPFTVGGQYHGRVVLTGRGGGPEVGVPISVSGATVAADPAATTGAAAGLVAPGRERLGGGQRGHGFHLECHGPDRDPGGQGGRSPARHRRHRVAAGDGTGPCPAGSYRRAGRDASGDAQPDRQRPCHPHAGQTVGRCRLGAGGVRLQLRRGPADRTGRGVGDGCLPPDRG